ncbi:MAG: penicillin-binding protein [Mollicutes bacterium]|nr:penicillin-binding protein [Mollicutes bacterium]
MKIFKKNKDKNPKELIKEKPVIKSEKKCKKLKVSNIKKKIKEFISAKGIKNFILYIILILGILVASLSLIFALYIIISSPDFNKDVLYSKDATVIYYKDGSELARIGEQNRQVITYEDLPQVFIDALLATEDSRFFQHNGLDLARFLKVSLKQLTGENAGGASTISMQVIKNLYTKGVKKETTKESLLRKFRDIYMAIFKLENCYTKEEILEFYVNTLWLGYDGNLNYTGISGVEQASKYYFGKSINELTLAESSLLVGMYQNARLYNPYKNPEGCRNRQKTVLRLMILHDYITEEEMNAVLKIPIQSLLVENGVSNTEEHQAAIDFVLRQVQEITGKNPYSNPMQIYSTIDKKVQNVMTRAEEGEFYKFPDDKIQLGIAVTSSEDGSIVALSGGRFYQAKGLNRATDISRQPGSAIKPIMDFAPYIEYLHGSPNDYFFDEPYTYSNGTKIRNADNGYMGMITMRKALVESRNIPSLQAFQRLQKESPGSISKFVHSLGIDYGPELYESASIGGFEGVSPLEMSAAFGAFARGGYYIKPYSFTKVIYDNGISFDYKYEKEQVMSSSTAYIMNDILADVITNNGIGKISVRGTTLCGKTGTTTIDADSRKQKGIPDDSTMDSWSVIYSPQYSLSMWYGYDELSKETFMTTVNNWRPRRAIIPSLSHNIFSQNKTFKKPKGIVSVAVESNTIPLQLPTAYTPEDMRINGVFLSGFEPSEQSSRFAKLTEPTGGKYTVDMLNRVTLSWNAAPLPDAMNTVFLKDYFNKNFGTFASKYYEKYITESTNIFGEFGYDIYKINSDGSTMFISWTKDTTFNAGSQIPGVYRYVIKSSYSNFKPNQSDGLIINVAINQSSEESQPELSPSLPQKPSGNNKP